MKKQSFLKGSLSLGGQPNFNANLAGNAVHFSGIIHAGLSTTFIERVGRFLDSYKESQASVRVRKPDRGGTFFAR